MNITISNDTDFERTVADTSGYIFTLSYRLTGSHDEAKDLMQETYLRAMRKWNTLKRRDYPLPWLRRICLNSFIDGYRKETAGPLARGVDFPSPEHHVASDVLTPEEELILDEDTRTVQSQCYTLLSSSLRLNQRIAFVLVDIFQVDIAEVSRLIQKSPTAVKSLLHRARTKMGRFLAARCGLVDTENLCRCAAWRSLSHDIECRREQLLSLLNIPDAPAGGDSGETLLRLYKTLPYLDPPS